MVGCLKLHLCERLIQKLKVGILNAGASAMVYNIFKLIPSERPIIKSLMEMDFLKDFNCPMELPHNRLEVPPRFDKIISFQIATVKFW